MNGINKIVRDSIFLRFAANEDQPPTKNTRFDTSLWVITAILSLALGLGLSGDHKLNANEIIAPTLPLVYIDKDNILNTDFTKPLPELNLNVNNANYSCTPSLLIPPTLIGSWEPCIGTGAPVDLSEEATSKIIDIFMKAENKRAVDFSGNKYAIMPEIFSFN